MYLDQYKIEGTINNDQNPCFHDETTYPQFQEELEMFMGENQDIVGIMRWIY